MKRSKVQLMEFEIMDTWLARQSLSLDVGSEAEKQLAQAAQANKQQIAAAEKFISFLESQEQDLCLKAVL